MEQLNNMTDAEFRNYLEQLAEDLAEAGNEFTSQDIYQARFRIGALMEENAMLVYRIGALGEENAKLKHLNKHLQRLTEPHVTLGATR